MAIGAQGLAIDPGMRQRGEHLFPVGAHQFGTDGGRRHLHQHNMIQPYPVKRVLKGKYTLNFMGQDHGLKNGLHGQWRLAIGNAFLRKMVGNRKNGAEIIGGVAPFGRQPGIVVIQPADDTAYVPGGFHRVQAVWSARHPGAVGNDRAFHQRAQVFGAFRKTQRQQTAAQGVHQAITGRFPGFFAFYAVIKGIVGDLLQYVVVVRAFVEIVSGRHITALLSQL